MSDRRSGRSSVKKINYAAFSAEGDDDDFDEDFKDATPPPSKKPKISNKENNIKKKARTNQEKQNAKNRKTPDERAFDRELQLAMEMSMHDSQSSGVENNEVNDPPQLHSEPFSITASVEAMEKTLNKTTTALEKNCDPPVLQPVINVCTNKTNAEDEDTIEVIETLHEGPSPRGKRKAATKPKKRVVESDEDVPTNKTNVEDEDTIEVIETLHEGPSPRGKRKAATKPKKRVVESDDDESDFNPDEDDAILSDDSDDDNDEDNDSDFEEFSKKQKGKGKNQKETKKKTTPPKSKSTAKSKKGTAVPKAVAPKSKPAGMKPTISPSVGRTMSSPVGRSLGGGHAKWTPPGSAVQGQSSVGSLAKRASLGGAGIRSPPVGGAAVKSPSLSLGGVSIKSPLSGLRLGLSRNQSVKPLHSGFKVQH